MSSEIEKKLEEKGLQIVRGLPIFGMYNKEIIDEAFNFTPNDGDIIIATYPKTGTSWMQYIVHQILTRGESELTSGNFLYNVVPFLELSGIDAQENSTRPRVYKHHFPYNLMKKNTKSKIIYVYRNPVDVVVSLYKFAKEVITFSYEFEQFFEDFISGMVPYGCYFDHIASYYQHRKDGNILFVSYEKLLLNPKGEIQKVSKFIGNEYYDMFVQDESILDKIVEHTGFENMKKSMHLIFYDEQSNTSADEIPFFSKGVTGEGKKTLDENQLKRLHEHVKSKLHGTEFVSEWFKD